MTNPMPSPTIESIQSEIYQLNGKISNLVARFERFEERFVHHRHELIIPVPEYRDYGQVFTTGAPTDTTPSEDKPHE